MLRAFNINRRRNRFVPSLGLGASTLEGRELLSGIGSGPHVVTPSSPPPNSSVGPIVADSSSGGATSPSPVQPIIWTGPYSA